MSRIVQRKPIRVIDLTEDDHPVRPQVYMGAAAAPMEDEVSEADTDVEEVFEVEKILNHRIRNGQAEYYVRWVGYSWDESSWEPARNLSGAAEAIKEFHSRMEQIHIKQEIIQ